MDYEKNLNKSKGKSRIGEIILVQNKGILALLLILIIFVVFVGTSTLISFKSVSEDVNYIRTDISSLNQTVRGLFNNQKFSEVIDDIEDSVFLILTKPVNLLPCTSQS